MYMLAAIDPVYLFLAGCAMLTYILLRRSYRYFGRRARSKTVDGMEHVHRPTSPWDGARRDVATYVTRQEVELYDLARDIQGKLDSKMILFQQLMAESQQKIERMESLLEEIKQVSGRTESSEPASC